MEKSSNGAFVLHSLIKNLAKDNKEGLFRIVDFILDNDCLINTPDSFSRTRRSSPSMHLAMPKSERNDFPYLLYFSLSCHFQLYIMQHILEITILQHSYLPAVPVLPSPRFGRPPTTVSKLPSKAGIGIYIAFLGVRILVPLSGSRTSKDLF
jgi:hypothetical protein